MREIVAMLNIPATTLRFWEDTFPQLSPERTPSRQRLYTSSDIEIINRIKFLLREKGLSLEYAKNNLNNYRKYPPRHEIACKPLDDVMCLLSDVKGRTKDAHIIVRIESVVRYLSKRHSTR